MSPIVIIIMYSEYLHYTFKTFFSLLWLDYSIVSHIYYIAESLGIIGDSSFLLENKWVGPK